MAERIRFTVSVDPEVHAAFVEMADAAGQSLSKAVGDWLGDTTDAARFVANQLREARSSPVVAVAQLRNKQALAVERTDNLLRDLRSGKLKVVDVKAAGGSPSAEPASSRRPRSKPPSSLTGVNTPRKGARA